MVTKDKRFDQLQEVSARKNNNMFGMIGILPRYNTMRCQLESKSGTLLVTCHKISATVQNEFQVFYLLQNVRYYQGYHA